MADLNIRRIFVIGPSTFEEVEVAQQAFLQSMQRLCTATDPEEVHQYMRNATQWLRHMHRVRELWGTEIDRRRQEEAERTAALAMSMGLTWKPTGVE